MSTNNYTYTLPFFKPGYEQEVIRELLYKAGIRLNGSAPFDIRVNDQRFYKYVFRNGSLGLGESYMAGYWSCTSLDDALYKLLSANLENYPPYSLKMLLYQLQGMLLNGQSVKKVRQDIHRHYDLGNDIFEAMLDKRMIYSCAYWQDAQTLEEAQEKKLDLICRKLQLKKGQRILDIGCGWGGLAAYSAERYGVEVVGITLSAEQAKVARRRCSHLPVEIRLQDYRSLHEKFDRVVSVGMMEHVGYKNYPVYMQLAERVMKSDGLFLLHTIGSNTSVKRTDPWINRYIFPNGMIPSMRQIAGAVEGRFVMEDWHNFGNYYDQTLMEWKRRFKEAWPELKYRYDDAFYRMWDYYLSCCAASFRAKKNSLWQMVFSKSGNHSFYVPER